MKENQQSFEINYFKVTQPIGDFYIASMNADLLVKITDFDVRRVLQEERDVERYLGIQRPLNPTRVKEIREYVTTKDACFPSGIIISIPAKCVEIDEEKNLMKISNFIDTEEEDEKVVFRKIARVLDGQHRLAGLNGYDGEFEVNVSIFVDTDISDQAIIFSTVNLAQTKVNRSLAYDLFDVMKKRSPQKTCHNIAVLLDREKDSPLFKMIKRLGVATPGRHKQAETLSQATFIEPLLKLISAEPMLDRDAYLRNKKPQKILDEKLAKHPFQHMFIEEKDFEITDIIWNYFNAVKMRWPSAWESRDRGVMLNRTNGYRALIRYLAFLFNKVYIPGVVPTTEDFFEKFEKMPIEDKDFIVDKFAPGTGGESALYRDLVEYTEYKKKKGAVRK